MNKAKFRYYIFCMQSGDVVGTNDITVAQSGVGYLRTVIDTEYACEVVSHYQDGQHVGYVPESVSERKQQYPRPVPIAAQTPAPKQRTREELQAKIDEADKYVAIAQRDGNQGEVARVSRIATALRAELDALNK